MNSIYCEHADDTRLSFIKKLFSECDFLCLQEIGLYKSQFSWFDQIDKDLGMHGVRAMDYNQLLYGRPHGGVVILWKLTLKAKVVPVAYESKRVCAVIIHLDSKVKLVLLCVYMPCDDRCMGGNLIEYVQIINYIEIPCNTVDADFVCIAGDHNTDLNKSTYQTRELIRYAHCTRTGLSFCIVLSLFSSRLYIF